VDVCCARWMEVKGGGGNSAWTACLVLARRRMRVPLRGLGSLAANGVGVRVSEEEILSAPGAGVCRVHLVFLTPHCRRHDAGAGAGIACRGVRWRAPRRLGRDPSGKLSDWCGNGRTFCPAQRYGRRQWGRCGAGIG